MSLLDYSPYVDPTVVPRLTKNQARMSLTAYPPFLERLVGMWSRLADKPFRGITADGHVEPGLVRERGNHPAPGRVAERATAWLDMLAPEERARVHFPVDSGLWRQWHNTPLLLRENQLELLALTPAQREGALALVRESLSAEGYRRTRTVMDNNLLLGRIDDLTDLLNDWSFTLSIFGRPSSASPWGWQLFGHHLSLNCLFCDGHMVLSPIFMGVEPDVGDGASNRRLFEPHEQAALAFARTLGERDRTRAVLHGSMLTAEQPDGRYHPDDGRQVGGAFQDNRIVPYEGVPVADLSRAQRHRLLGLAEIFLATMPDDPAAARLREIERQLDRTRFAWIGPINDVDPFYFRIHSPVALIEFDHHSGIFLANTDPARFHVHTIVRTPNGGDYGHDLLAHHYAAGGHHGHASHHHGHAHSHDGGQTFHSHD
ncbi:MAG: DUF3500 domain-containing protein [Sphingomonas adhaesiva]|uniref:DUF3500 domain-containing protein n=1 Tax=Sphingomonas adhaesiva TaxID=28212 RepID=UPI002FFAE0C5